MNRLPPALTFFRLAAGVGWIPLALCHAGAGRLVALLLAGLASDVADGIVARRLGVATLALRRLDTRADLVFYGFATAAALATTPIPVAVVLPWCAAYCSLCLLRNLVDYFCYRASPSYHMWSGKLWSLVLCMHLGLLFCGRHAFFLLPAAFVLYALNAAEGIIASLTLPGPRQDVPSVWHALKSLRST